MQANQITKKIDTSLKNLGDEFYNQYLNTRKGAKETRTGQDIFKSDLQEVISPTSVNSERLLKPEAKKEQPKNQRRLKNLKNQKKNWLIQEEEQIVVKR